LTTDEFLEELRWQLRMFDTQKDAAEAWAISAQYLSDVLRGVRAPGQMVASALGFSKSVCFTRLTGEVRSDSELLDWLEFESSLAMDTILIGQEEFSERFVIIDENIKPSELGAGDTLREAIQSVIDRQARVNQEFEPELIWTAELTDAFLKRRIDGQKSVADLETPGGAWACCGEACTAFRAFLKERSIESDLVLLAGLPDMVMAARRAHYAPGELEEADMNDLEIHYVVRVCDWYYDWTARQYTPEAAFPYIVKEADLIVAGWRPIIKPDNATPEQDRECADFLAEVFTAVKRRRGEIV
jgi:hypothetical protein